MHSRPGRKTKDSGRRMSPDPIIEDARVWIVGTILLFVLSFAAVRWLPDLMTRSPHSISKSTAGSSTLTSEVRTTSLEQSVPTREIARRIGVAASLKSVVDFTHFDVSDTGSEGNIARFEEAA
jgi:hypothetical protein